jgi:uncharacterized membrane protein
VLTRALIFATLALQLLWQLWWSPPQVVPAWLGAALMSLPILPAVLLALLRRPSAGFWGGVAALLYFSHGVMEWWTTPAARGPAIVQTALAVALIFASSWAGLQARLRSRRGE